jgi:hypothetical protein
MIAWLIKRKGKEDSPSAVIENSRFPKPRRDESEGNQVESDNP